jgi:hypothetical protein
MSLKLVPLLILALAAAVIGYGLWRRNQDPPRVIATGTFKFTDKHGAILVFPQRRVAVAGFETTEIQLPGGTWIDCRGDCAATIKAEHTEFWDSQMLRTR